MSSIDASIAGLAPTRVTVLVDGGSAKDRAAVARALHDRAPRRHEPFSTINCADATHQEIARVLGGPVSQRAPRVTGLGTLYITNVDAMPRWLQPRFLGFLDGERRPRVVASARSPLVEVMRTGHFRSDLAERLLLVRLFLGPLDDTDGSSA